MPHGTPRSLPVLDLPARRSRGSSDRAACREAAHQQQRHQVLEHRAAPRHQRRAAVDVGDQPSEMEPVMLRHVALGDGDEAGQPRFRRQQVVERAVEPARARRRRPGDSRSRRCAGAGRRGTRTASRRRAPSARRASARSASAGARRLGVAERGDRVEHARAPEARCRLSLDRRTPLATRAQRRAARRASASSDAAVSAPSSRGAARRRSSRARRLIAVDAPRGVVAPASLDDDAAARSSRGVDEALEPLRSRLRRARRAPSSPARARSARRPGCRCRRWRRSADAAAPASPCRTS